MISVDKAPRLSISIVIWILSSDTICQLNHLFSNSEAAMLSSLGGRLLPALRISNTVLLFFVKEVVISKLAGVSSINLRDIC